MMGGRNVNLAILDEMNLRVASRAKDLQIVDMPVASVAILVVNNEDLGNP
jgi:hypothetical protein